MGPASLSDRGVSPQNAGPQVHPELRAAAARPFNFTRKVVEQLHRVIFVPDSARDSGSTGEDHAQSALEPLP